jgi:hypothetical protein
MLINRWNFKVSDVKSMQTYWGVASSCSPERQKKVEECLTLIHLTSGFGLDRGAYVDAKGGSSSRVDDRIRQASSYLSCPHQPFPDIDSDKDTNNFI